MGRSCKTNKGGADWKEEVERCQSLVSDRFSLEKRLEAQAVFKKVEDQLRSAVLEGGFEFDSFLSDDSLEYLLWHIVGLGQQTYDRVLVEPFRSKEYVDDAIEGFAYIFLSEEEQVAKE